MRYGRMLLVGLCLALAGAAKVDPNVEKAAELRKQYPTGIVVVDAQWGKGNKEDKDVTDECQAMVDGDSLTVFASDEAFSETDDRGGQLHIVYDDGKGLHKKTVNSGGKLQVGEEVTCFVGLDRGMVRVKPEVETLRKKYPTGLLVLDARWGMQRAHDFHDERDLCQGLVSGDSLTVENREGAFREGDAHEKDLQVVVFDGKSVKTLKVQENGVLQIGDKVTSFIRTGVGLQSVDKTVADLRKKHPTGLLILDANRGGNRDANDVTDLCQSLVWGDSLTIQNSDRAFRDGHDNNVNLVVTYFDGEVLKTAKVANDGTIQIGPKVTSFMKLGAGMQNLEGTAAKLGAKHPGAILILDAEWGKNNDWRDVQDVVQGWVSGDSLNVKVKAQAFGQEGSNGEELKVTYYNGGEVHETKVGEGTFLKVMAVLPEAMSGLVMLPDTVTVGDTVTHEFGVKGDYRLESGPDGATLSATGKLVWKPTAEQAGGQEFKITCTINGQAYTTTVHCEVVTADGAGAKAGPVRSSAVARGKKGASGRNVETNGEHYYVANVDFADSLLLEKDRLTVLGGDGVSVVRVMKLEHAYVRMAERAGYFVGIRLDPMVMDLLDKNSGKVIKTIKLGYRAFRDLALVPGKTTSFVSVEYADSVPRDRIVVVDESTGEVREPKELSGTFLQMDRSGKHLWVGLKDIFTNGVEYHMNPDWNLIEIPQYGNVDMLLRFDLVDGELVLKDHVTEAGGNGYGIRVSPDGERVTYLSFVGFPLFSKNIASWAGLDFEKKPVVYEVKGKAECRTMNYHPVLPVVVVPKEDGVIIFGRESGDEESGRVNLPASLLGNGRVVEAYFSADGMNVVLDCEDGGKNVLRKVPLLLSAEEKAKVAAGVKPLVIEDEPKRNPGLQGM